MMVHHDESPRDLERIPFRVVMALSAMGAMNQRHASVHGAHMTFSRPGSPGPGSRVRVRGPKCLGPCPCIHGPGYTGPGPWVPGAELMGSIHRADMNLYAPTWTHTGNTNQ